MVVELKTLGLLSSILALMLVATAWACATPEVPAPSPVVIVVTATPTSPPTATLPPTATPTSPPTATLRPTATPRPRPTASPRPTQLPLPNVDLSPAPDFNNVPAGMRVYRSEGYPFKIMYPDFCGPVIPTEPGGGQSGYRANECASSVQRWPIQVVIADFPNPKAFGSASLGVMAQGAYARQAYNEISPRNTIETHQGLSMKVNVARVSRTQGSSSRLVQAYYLHRDESLFLVWLAYPDHLESEVSRTVALALRSFTVSN